MHIWNSVEGAAPVTSFRGRTEPLSEIFQYVAADTPTPLIIEGEAGIGKTALIARAADELQLTHRHADLITRFVGATPSASNGNSLLRGICRDLAARYGRAETQTLNSGREMGRAFLEALAWASAQRPVVIFIDALDELAGTDDLQYVPATPPLSASPCPSRGDCNTGGSPRRAPAAGSTNKFCEACPAQCA